MLHVTAWATRSALSNPVQFADDAVSLGLDGVNIMLNDFSGAREPTQFKTHSRSQLEALSAELHDVGLDVTLTTWVMPHDLFIRGMVEQLPTLIESMGAVRLDLDAEEPWTQSRDSMPFGAAADQIALGMTGYAMGLSGIPYANTEALMPLAEICPVWLPQCYARPVENSMDPDHAVTKGVELWRSKFGNQGRIIAGLAGWDMGSDPLRFMTPVVHQALDVGLHEVCYWTAQQLMTEATPAEFVRGVARPRALDIEALPVNPARSDVWRLQSMLESAAVEFSQGRWDPGKIDGKPGGDTLGALKRYQSDHGMSATGVATRAVYWSLLGSGE